MHASVRHGEGRAYVAAVPGGYAPPMERESIEDQPGIDDQEFSSVEDVGTPPSENPAVDDV
jgi:hypothetical protein